MQSPSPETEVQKEAISLSLNADSTAAASESPSTSTIPTIIISQHDDDSSSEEPERAEPEEQEVVAAQAALSMGETLTQDKKEDCDNPLTSHLKMIFKGLRRSKSQESLASAKTADEEELQQEPDDVPHCSHNGGVAGVGSERPSWRHFHRRSSSSGTNKGKGKEHGTLPRGEDPQRSQVNWEQLEATKAIFDLLKEISGARSLLTREAKNFTAQNPQHCS